MAALATAAPATAQEGPGDGGDVPPDAAQGLATVSYTILVLSLLGIWVVYRKLMARVPDTAAEAASGAPPPSGGGGEAAVEAEGPDATSGSGPAGFCPQCGAAARPGAAYCASCGAALGGGAR